MTSTFDVKFTFKCEFSHRKSQAIMTLIDTRTPDAKRLIPGATGDWEIIIGLEVHAQITSEAKLFSGASTAFGAAPNANVSLVDARSDRACGRGAV